MDIDEISDGSGVAQRSLTLGRRKKDLARNSISITSFKENQDIVRVSRVMEPSSDAEVMEPRLSDVRSAPRVAKIFMEENCSHGSQALSVRSHAFY